MDSEICISNVQSQLTWYLTPFLWLVRRMVDTLSAALTGTVLFSTTILLVLAVSAIIRATDSTYDKLAARPCQIRCYSNHHKWRLNIYTDIYEKKLHPGSQGPITLGHKVPSGWYESEHAMEHRGVMWLAPCPATFDSLVCRHSSQLGGLQTHQNHRPRLWFKLAVPSTVI